MKRVLADCSKSEQSTGGLCQNRARRSTRSGVLDCPEVYAPRGNHGTPEAPDLFRGGDQGAAAGRVAALVFRGRLDPPEVPHRRMERDADGSEHGRPSRRSRVAPPRSHSIVRVRDREAAEPRCQGHYRPRLRTGEEDRGGGAVAAGQGRRRAERHAERRPALPLHQVRRLRGLGASFCCAAVIVSGAAGAGDALPVTENAAGIHVHLGAQAEASPVNRGAIANVGFIVGNRCVAVIDTGGSPAVGRSLRAAIRAVTPLPVCYVINTHVHPDHILGNAAFVGDNPEFVGHAKLAAAMAARGRVYVAAAKRALGADAADAGMVPPTRSVTGNATLDLGDRTLELRAWPTAHTDHDLTIFDVRTGTLWLSDLLFIERIPVVDGSLRGWLEVLADLKRLDARLVVPGHGTVTGDWPGAAAAQERYLRALLGDTRAALRAGKTLQEAVETVGGSGREGWLLFEAFHRRNVTAAFAELEWEE